MIIEKRKSRQEELEDNSLSVDHNPSLLSCQDKWKRAQQWPNEEYTS